MLRASTLDATEHSLTDDAYAKLLAQVARRKFDLTTPDLRANIMAFYSDLSIPIETKKNPGEWQTLLLELDQLKSREAVNSAAR